MSSVFIQEKQTQNNYDLIKNNISDFKNYTKIEKNSKADFKVKLNKYSNKILPETALLTMIKLLVDHRDQITITNSILSINSEDLDLAQKLNYYMEILAHIPFSFQYNKQQTKIILDFFHLEDEIQLLTNLEI